jgi:hypothetical protein
LLHLLIGGVAGRAAPARVAARGRVFDAEDEIVAPRQDDGQPAPRSASYRVICPVHHVEAQVQLSGTGGNEYVALSDCSLHPGNPGGPPCEGRCIVLGEDGTPLAAPLDRGAAPARASAKDAS